ncbi:MAG: hypothetical protein RBR41_09190 [Desulfovibrio sp.]|uniref:hypothetical protein n=1 Tax=Desulfovibrio sp. TaxID=885 RepID=UPI002A35B7A1|nr:hypothetical protein [Desulfovibrio sp.]MDY0259822.1 hypothetical protein [Desulfovibrio sp.]
MSQRAKIASGRIVLAMWCAGLLALLLPALWTVRAEREAARERLAVEARNTAVQLSALLAVPAWDVDELAARTIVMAAMEDESIYAVKVQTPQGMLEGQRRNYQWEPVPWDDEIDEEAVSGVSPLRVEGRPVGTVEVYVSPRVSQEGAALTARRETWRFVLSFLCWTAALAFLWRTRLQRDATGDATGEGGAQRTPWHEPKDVPLADVSPVDAPAVAAAGAEALSETAAPCGQVHAERVSPCHGDGVDAPGAESSEPQSAPLEAGEVVSPALGLAFMRRHDHAWQVTAGLFRHSFAHGPELMGRLYAAGDVAALCRLGDLLERAAPCLGAERLGAAARDMQTALHCPDRERATLAVEECVLALDAVLDTLR